MRRRTKVGCRSVRPPTRSVTPRARNARTLTSHIVPVALRWELASGSLALTASTRRRGASYDDYWSVSPSLPFRSATVADSSVAGAATYVSQAVVPESSLMPDTTYTFSYAIAMRTGASAWFGSGSVAVTFGPAGSLSFP